MTSVKPFKHEIIHVFRNYSLEEAYNNSETYPFAVSEKNKFMCR